MELNMFFDPQRLVGLIGVSCYSGNRDTVRNAAGKEGSVRG